jgi:hypothetical protein
MSNYNFIERKLAFILSKFPKLKLYSKKLYQKLNYLIYKKKYNHQAKYALNKLSYNGCESFFGYYDKSPINKSNTYIIFQSTNTKTSELPDPNTAVDLILFDCMNDKYELIDKVYSYNWQQGCKLMWLNDDVFIYNNYDSIDKKYISKIYNVKDGKFKNIGYPIYDSFNYDFSISLNFERLNIGRGDYSYNNSGKSIDWSNKLSDGLFYIDLKTNSSKLIVSIADAIKINEKANHISAKHKFNHIMISPDGDKIMFMHRWFLEDNRRFDALLVCNTDGSELKIVANDDMVSHCYWYDNDTILAYLRYKGYGDKYYIFDIFENQKKIVGSGLLDSFGDGHPSVFRKNILFDTYPDKSRMKNLFLYDIAAHNLIKLGEFKESFKYYAETRCDLHPRLSGDGKKVFFDSVHTGKRYLYYMNLEN